MTYAICASSSNAYALTFQEVVDQYEALFSGVLFFGFVFSVPIFLIVIYPILVVGNRFGVMTPVVLISVGACIPGAFILASYATGWGGIFWLYDRHGVLALACAMSCGALGGAVSCLGLTERRG